MLETKTATIFIEQDIVFLIYKEKADVGVDEINENIEAKIKLQKGIPMRTIVDVRRVWQYSDEARKIVSSSRFNKITTAMAVVTGHSLPIRMVGNFFMKINKPITPTKLFTSKEEGLSWLRTFKK